MTDAKGAAAAFFTELVDAVRYARSWVDSVEKHVEARKELEHQLDALEEVQSKVAALFNAKELDPGIAEPMAKAVNEFVAAAVKQGRVKIEDRQKKAMDVLSTEADSLRSKSIKSLESFLAVSPLPVLDEEVVMELSSGSYAASAKFKCAGEIAYHFLLNTANSKLFASAPLSSSAWRGLRIPVRLGKTWLKKEPVPDYEKLDNYVMASAMASKNHLDLRLTNQTTAAAVTIVFSRSSTDSFVTIEYSDQAGATDVTGEPSLTRYLDLAAIKNMDEHLLDAIMALDGEKLRLTKLDCSGQDILATLDCFGFMQHVMDVFLESGEYAQAIHGTDEHFALERLSLLGDKSNLVADSLGLGGRPARPLSKTK